MRLFAQIDPSGLVLYLPFHGNATDESNSHHPVFVNGASLTAGLNDEPGEAYYFDGISNSITIPNMAELDGQLQSFTILIRMMPMDLKPIPEIPAPYGAAYTFLTWHRKTSDSLNSFLHSKLHMAWQPPLNPGSEHKQFLGYIMDWCSSFISTASGYSVDSALVDHKWVTVALVFDKGILKTYHNCKLTGNWENYPAVSELCGTDPMQISIGNVPQGVFQYGYRYFKGKIDELRIYKRALTDNEIKEYADTTCKLDIVPVVEASILANADACRSSHYLFTDNSAVTDFTAEQREWKIDSDDPVIKDSVDYLFTRTGNHTVQLTLRNKDTSFSVTNTVYIDSLAPLRFLSSAGSDFSICENSSAQINVRGGQRYQWQPCLYLDDCNTGNPVVTPKDSVSYLVRSENMSGCKDSLQVKVKMIKDTIEAFIPTAFSPNGDGHNDSFGVLSFLPVTGIRLSVYNIFGQAVFTSNSKESKWNGKYKNTNQPAGTYVWKLQYQSGNGCSIKTKSGTVELVR